MISANSFVPNPVVFTLIRDPLMSLCKNQSLINHKTRVGTSEERWFAYSVEGYTNALVFGAETSPTMDGHTASQLWAQIGAFVLRFKEHWVALKGQQRFDEMQTLRTVYLQLAQFVNYLLQHGRVPPVPS